MLNPRTDGTFGTDPEAFFSLNGHVIGSEKLIPADGTKVNKFGKIIRDGVQFELNPVASKSIPVLGNNVGRLLTAAHEATQGHSGVSVNFDGVVEVSRNELDSLSPACRVLGCMPSYNIYGDKPINVNPVTYRKRSAGGHIHIGMNSAIRPERVRMVALMDILVGNTCVLLDRDPGAAERRENYGRAGEYRLPSYGLEYRTTSNFWLRNYALMDLVFGLTNIALSLMQVTINGNHEPWNNLAEVVEIEKIQESIDTNNFQLALRNFQKVSKFIKTYVPDHGFPLSADNVSTFVAFAKDANKRGIDYYFPTENIIQSWNQRTDFRTFLMR